MILAHITDPHVRPRGRLAYGAVDTEAALRRAVAAVVTLVPHERHGEPGQPGGVVHGPVERVDNPARARARAARARLLGEDRGSGRQPPQALDDKLLGGEIRCGHDVAMLLAGDADILPLHGDAARLARASAPERRRCSSVTGGSGRGNRRPARTPGAG